MFREFKDIVSYIRNNESGIAGDIYVGSRFLIARNCNPFLRLLLKKKGLLKPMLSVWPLFGVAGVSRLLA